MTAQSTHLYSSTTHQSNEGLVQAKIFTYKLQVENHLATWTRNALLATNVGIAIYNQGSQRIGQFVIATAVCVLAWALFTYLSNFNTWQTLTLSRQKLSTISIFVSALGALIIAHLSTLI